MPVPANGAILSLSLCPTPLLSPPLHRLITLSLLLTPKSPMAAKYTSLNLTELPPTGADVVVAPERPPVWTERLCGCFDDCETCVSFPLGQAGWR